MSGSNLPPAPAVQANGSAVITDQYLNGMVQGAMLLADMRNFVGLNNMTAFMIGYTSPSDGGQGIFYFNSSSTTPDDGGISAIAPNGLLVGRWLRQTLTTGVIDQLATGKFYQNNGAVISRLNDRLFVGGATANDGDNPNVAKDWLTDIVSWAVFTAQAAVESISGQIAITAGSQTLQSPASGLGSSADAIGVAAWGINNITTQNLTAWAYYAEARRYPSVTGATFGMEVEIMNVSGNNSLASTPYAQITTGLTAGLWVGSGGDAPAYGLTAMDATIGLAFINNFGTFLTGISFGATAIQGTNGKDGNTGEAIALATGHVIRWYTPSGSAGPFIYSSQTAAGAPGLIFTNGSVEITGGSGAILALQTTSPTNGSTAMVLLVNNNAGLNAVTVALGAANSGGTGLRALVVPN